jgi:hypothetical protein
MNHFYVYYLETWRHGNILGYVRKTNAVELCTSENCERKWKTFIIYISWCPHHVWIEASEGH